MSQNLVPSMPVAFSGHLEHAWREQPPEWLVKASKHAPFA